LIFFRKLNIICWKLYKCLRCHHVILELLPHDSCVASSFCS